LAKPSVGTSANAAPRETVIKLLVMIYLPRFQRINNITNLPKPLAPIGSHRWRGAQRSE
jgi:hypothetical protein